MTFIGVQRMYKCDCKILGGPVECKMEILIKENESLTQFQWLINGDTCLCPAHKYLIEGAPK